MRPKNQFLIDGKKIKIRPLTRKENVRECQRFINTMTSEGAYLLVDRPLTFEEEKTWLKNHYQANKKGEQFFLKVMADDTLIGFVHAERGLYRNKGNVTLGIALAKQWRGKGLGRLLLKEMINQVEYTWHPKNIYLHVVASNKNAHALYTSLGFRPIARLPHWFEYNGKYLDELILLLDKKLNKRRLQQKDKESRRLRRK